MSSEIEIHWAVRYTIKVDAGTSTTEYGTDESAARQDFARVRAEWPYTAELLKRTVRIGPWKVTDRTAT